MPRPRQPDKAKIPPGDNLRQPGDEPQQPQPQQQRGELEKIGALWKKKSKKGFVYLSGVCHDERIMIFPVKEEYKTSEKSPDYNIMRSRANDDEIPF